MRVFFVCLLLLSTFRLTLASGNVIIYGKDIAYKGKEIVFNEYSDLISGSEKEAGRSVVGEDGSFSVSFEIDEITFIFSYLGIYKVHIYAEPGKKYEVVLPPLQEKVLPDLLNPYFTPVIIHLGIVNYETDDLNTSIRMYNDAFLPYFNKHIEAVALKKSNFSELDDDIAAIEKPFASSTDTFFNDYRKYRYGTLRYLAFQHLSKSISNEYFRGKPVLINNPAYMELFGKVYDGYFHHISRSLNAGKLYSAVQSKNIDSLRLIIASDQVIGPGDLPDLIILKFIYNEFYNDNFSRNSLLNLLNSFISENRLHKLSDVAVSIRDEVTRLLSGFPPPDFELYNKDSVLVKLGDFKGKYIYINFCSCFSYTCLNEFAHLAKIYEKHRDLIEIVTIIVDNDYDVLRSFLDRSNYKWTFLHYGNQSSIIRDYDIRAFPTYYLIDREGKLALSPAPSPGEEFEARFFTLLRSRGEL